MKGLYRLSRLGKWIKVIYPWSVMDILILDDSMTSLLNPESISKRTLPSFIRYNRFQVREGSLQGFDQQQWHVLHDDAA
jgi:hypothetical protein